MNPVPSTTASAALNTTAGTPALPRAVGVSPARPAVTGRGAAAQPPAKTGAAGPSKPSVPFDERWLLAALFAFPLGVTLRGFHYYLEPLGLRMRDPLHPWLRPGGGLGIWFGVAGFAMFVFLWLYPLRKRYNWLAWTGPLGQWLNVHIMAGLWMPLVVAVHAAWRFEGLIGLGYYAMILVVLSGVVGRYLYVRIPRSRSGIEMSLEEVATERRALVTRISAAVGLDAAEVEKALAIDQRPDEGQGLAQTAVRLVNDDRARWRAVRAVHREWSQGRPGMRPLDRRTLDATMKLVRREMKLSQQMRMLDATHKIFGFWHVAHRPVAITALLAIVIHVIVAIGIGGVGGAGR